MDNTPDYVVNLEAAAFKVRNTKADAWPLNGRRGTSDKLTRKESTFPQTVITAINDTSAGTAYRHEVDLPAASDEAISALSLIHI